MRRSNERASERAMRLSQQYFTKDVCRNLSNLLVKAAQDLPGVKGVMQVRSAGGRFDSLRATLKIEFVPTQKAFKEATGTNKSPEQIEFENCCFMIGLKASDYRRKFKTFGGDEYELVAIHLNRRKYPLVATRTSDGRRFKFMTEQFTVAVMKEDQETAQKKTKK